MKLLGITDQMNTCDCCGRTDLKCTVAFDNEGTVVYYGRVCATRWYNKPTKEINAELKAIKEIAYQEAASLWRNDTARLEYNELVKKLNNGPKMHITERLEVIRPVAAKEHARKMEILEAVSSKYMLTPSDIYLAF